jgi:hypothetical protein
MLHYSSVSLELSLRLDLINVDTLYYINYDMVLDCGYFSVPVPPASVPAFLFSL